jgi:capsular polysaccharide transport system permease protein
LEATTKKKSIGERIGGKLSSSKVILWCTILVPTLLAAVYYGLIASDVYISESRFVVRSPQRPQQSGLVGAFLQSTGFTRSQDDTYSVRDFILSRDALSELNTKLGIKAAYSRKEIDLINRFPGLDWDDSFEAFHRYYRKRVDVEYDPASSISVLTVRAFSPDDAKRFNDLLLTMGERLVNNLNDRSRIDLIRTAEQEVKTAEERTKNAALALSAFRSSQSVFDPDRQSGIQLQAVAKLQEELITTEAQLAQLTKLSPGNPQVPVLKARTEDLRKTITAETAKVTGAATSFTSKSANFERLSLEKGFAERQLTTALAALETAKSEAQRKQLYLERLVQPSTPDKAMEPRRLRAFITVFLVGLIAYGVAMLLTASVREHLE